jgi:hypothetical protein
MQFGYSIAVIHDLIESDDSLAVGAPYYNDGANYYAGKVFVFQGSSSGLDSTVDWTSTGTALYQFFGYCVADAGDVNGDGKRDLAVGLPTANGSYGAVKIWHGSISGLSSSPDSTITDTQLDTDFGRAVASAGDINGDSYDDLIVGAPLYDNGQSDEGRVFIYEGDSTGLNTSASWTAESDQAGAQLGFSVASAGDYDFDGYSSVIVGAPYWNHTNSDDGRAWVWDGSSSGLGSNGTPSNADWATSNVGPNYHTGYSVGKFSTPYFRGVVVGVPGADNVVLFDY